jgi:ABC-type proline/glycine betaine transport system permease subunit
MKELFKLAAVITMEGLEGVRNGLNTAEKEAKKLSKTLVQTGKKIESIGSKMSMLITLPVAAAGAAIYKLTEGASDLSETIAKSEQIFGDAAKQIDEWSNSSATAFGQSKKQAIDAASTFAIFGKSAGKTGDELVKFSTQFTQLASDFASFYNTSPEDAITAIGAAFRGENEPIRRYGILLDDASMRQEALKLGIIDSVKNALTPQQKVLAASALIMKQSSDAQGGFQRESGGLANQQRMLSAEIKNLVDDLGKAFLPTVTNIVKIIRSDFVPILKTTANIIKQIPPDVLSFAAGMGIAAAAIGPLLVGLGKVLTAYKDIQIAIKGVTFLLAGNPFGLAVMGVAAITGAVIGLVNEYKNLRKEHQKYVLQTTEKATIDEFTNRVNNLKKTIAQYGDELKDPAKAQEILGKQMQEATEFARQLGYTVEGDLYQRMNKLAIISDKVNGVMYKYVNGKMVAIDYTKLLAEETQDEVDVTSELTEELEKQLIARRKLLDERAELEDEYANKVFEQHANDIEILDKKYREELLKADELGADKLNIEKWYQTEKQRIIDQAAFDYEQSKNKEVEEAQKTADRIAEIDKELAETRKRLEREVAEERKQQVWGVVSFISDSFNQLGSILSMFNSNRLDEIDQWEARQREEIENSILSEEEKDAKLQALEEEAAKREQEAKRRQAKQNKALGIFNIIISTAQAIMKAWTELPWVMAAVQSAVIGTLGTAQAAVVAAQPIPLAKGGFVESVPGGVNTIVGEGRQDELVLPLETGVDMMVNKLVEGIGSADRAISPASAIGSTTYVTENHYHIGTLVGDDSGYKQLERRLELYRTSELSRRGQ